MQAPMGWRGVQTVPKTRQSWGSFSPRRIAPHSQALFSATVCSPTDALTIARANPDRDVVFFAIGFETTTPPTAAAVKIAATENRCVP